MCLHALARPSRPSCCHPCDQNWFATNSPRLLHRTSASAALPATLAHSNCSHLCHLSCRVGLSALNHQRAKRAPALRRAPERAQRHAQNIVARFSQQDRACLPRLGCVQSSREALQPIQAPFELPTPVTRCSFLVGGSVPTAHHPDGVQQHPVPS